MRNEEKEKRQRMEDRWTDTQPKSVNLKWDETTRLKDNRSSKWHAVGNYGGLTCSYGYTAPTRHVPLDWKSQKAMTF